MEAYIKEATLTKKVKTHLSKLKSTFSWKCADRYYSGLPDFIVCYRGRFLAIELKATGKKPRNLQRYVIQKIIDSGGVSFYADSYEMYLKKFRKAVNDINKNDEAD